MLELEVLVWESAAVDALSSSSIEVGEVSSLHHEVSNHSVEDAALEVEGLSVGGLLA